MFPVLIDSPPLPPPPIVRSVQDIIRAAAEEFGQSPEKHLRISFCESTHRTWVYGDNGKALGLFQFHLDTWNEEAPKLGYYEDLRADAEASSRVAAHMMSRGMSNRWTCK